MLFSSEVLKTMRQSCERMRDHLKEVAFKPTGRKKLDISFGPTVAAELLGRTPEALAKAEAKGRLPAPRTLPNGRRYYTVEDLAVIREALGIHPGKAPGEDAAVIAIQNFKGGVGKSTLTKHLADYLGLRGYRVLVIDCDPQASTTTMFDIQPEHLIDDPDVLSNYLSPRSGLESLKATIRPTAWPTIDIIPSNLGLQDTEWDLTATIQEGFEAVKNSMQRLRIGLIEVVKDYDVILLDPPPAMGFLALNTIAAATGLLIPVPARQLDYLSTIHFMSTVEENLRLLDRIGNPVDYGFIRVVCSLFSPNRPGEADMWRIMQSTYAGRLISQPILHSEEIKNAGQVFQSIYEASKPFGSHQTYTRCRDNLNSVFGQVEEEIRRQWASHRAKLGGTDSLNNVEAA